MPTNPIKKKYSLFCLKMCHSFLIATYAKGNIVILAMVHLKKAKLIGPAKCIAYLDTIKLPDQITVLVIANRAPN